jgi:hypothetical protein
MNQTPSLTWLSSPLDICIHKLTNLTMAEDWSPVPAGRWLCKQVGGDVRLLRLAQVRVQSVFLNRPTAQGARALSTLSRAIHATEAPGNPEDPSSDDPAGRRGAEREPQGAPPLRPERRPGRA